MTVFFNFFEKSATKHQLVYRYGARKGNLTFFQNYSLNRGLLSLYEVEEEKSFEKMSEIQDEWTVLCGRRKLNYFHKISNKWLFSGQCYAKEEKTIVILYSKALFVSSVGARKKKLYFISWFCIQAGIGSWVLMWKEENIFIFNLTFDSCRSLYGAKKIFHSTVGRNGIVWVVRVWKEKVLSIGYAFALFQRGI